ncbi:hypothetical protein C8A03DRAFT_33357 [Achaetomium macrosporum]|uniref:Uncharacterized protein n=1 Tax=Achaetomium macrosporum TaxID=79813 RepID=A0AAN7CAY5_9PEZI|nr:hypothetical protein C8A03DRAFT_33357 [Achaetomium macrosporum]
MNRSRYIPPTAYSINAYQPYGVVPTQSQMQPGMMPSQPMGLPPQATYSNPQQHQSPVQASLSPNAMWTANFANGPIIEDLCAPPPPPPPIAIPSAPPPHMRMHAAHTMGPMHPGAMPQVQNVYGVRQPVPHPAYAQGAFPGQPMQGIPATRVMGTYPPYVGVGQPQPQPQSVVQHPTYPVPPNAAAMMGRPRLETGFPSAPVSAGGQHTVSGSSGGMGQMGSPDSMDIGASPAGEMELTPVEEALRGFLSGTEMDLGELGRA